MGKFRHLVYYDIGKLARNARLEAELPRFCEKLTTIYVEDDYPQDLAASEFSDCDGLVTGVFDNYERRLAASSNLRHIFMLATDVSDFKGCRLEQRQVSLSSGAGYSTESVAELQLAMLALLARNVLLQGLTIGPPTAPGREVGDLSVGIVGAGRIGGALGVRLSAVAKQVLYCSRRSSPELEARGALRRDLLSLCKTADAISINLPLDESTRSMLGRDELSVLKPGTIILCPSRPEIIDIEALESACQDRDLALWLDGEVAPELLERLRNRIKRLVVTPSLGARTLSAQHRLVELAVNNLTAYTQRGSDAAFSA